MASSPMMEGWEAFGFDLHEREPGGFVRLVIGEDLSEAVPVPVIEDSPVQLMVRTEHYSGRIHWENDEATFNVQSGFEPFGRINAFRIVSTVLAYREGGFTLHAGSALKEGQAWLFCGPSGVGKTTTLQRLGWPVLHDDLACVALPPPSSSPAGGEEKNSFPSPSESSTHPSGVRGEGQGGGDFRAFAWAPVALDAPRYPVRAVFVLAQGEKSGWGRLSAARAAAELIIRPQVLGAAVDSEQLVVRLLRFLDSVPAFTLTLNLEDRIEPLLEEAAA